MDSQGGHVMTIANSIIGVSILAMPYCFKQCGIILSSFMLILSSIISRLSCHFLLKSAIISRLRTIEFLAYHAFGPLGKFVIEIGIIGFLLGTCIAFFVVMGDLGPQIIAEMFLVPLTDTLRTTVLIIIAVFCILPLGLLRQVDSLSVVCTAAIGFYICLVLKIMAESAPHLMTGDWYDKVEFWRSEGLLQCLPIFSMALFCQTQLFEIYQSIPNASLDRMNSLIRAAVNICTCVYIFVGIFGYIAVSNQPFTGNILLSFKPSIITEIMKIGFVMSVAFSFPLIIFPCRASLFSLIYKPTYTLMHDGGRHYIPDSSFRYLTVIIIAVSLIIGILIPNIELVLGLVGSTIGVLICVLFPATAFICMSKKNTNERILAQIMLFVGVLVMVLGTYANLNASDDIAITARSEKIVVVDLKKEMEKKLPIIDIPTTVKTVAINNQDLKREIEDPIAKNEVAHEIRHEPPQPVEPEPEPVKETRHEPPQPVAPDPNSIEVLGKQPEPVKPDTNFVTEKKINSDELAVELPPNIEEVNIIKVGGEKVIENGNKEKKVANKEKQNSEGAMEQVDSEAIKKEEKEMRQQEIDGLISVDKKSQLNELQKQTKELLKKQQEILEEIQQSAKEKKQDFDELQAEKMKSIKEIETIAKNAIESLVDLDTNTEKNILRDIIQPKKAKFDLNSNGQLQETNFIRANAAPLSYQLGLNASTNEAKKAERIPLVPENFVPLPLAKSNLSTYNFESKKNATINNYMQEIPKLEEARDSKLIANNTEHGVKDNIINNANFNPLENENQNKETLNAKKEGQNEQDLDDKLKQEEKIKQEEKLAMQSVRRDILSLNKSRERRDVSDKEKQPCKNCEQERLQKLNVIKRQDAKNEELNKENNSNTHNLLSKNTAVENCEKIKAET